MSLRVGRVVRATRGDSHAGEARHGVVDVVHGHVVIVHIHVIREACARRGLNASRSRGSRSRADDARPDWYEERDGEQYLCT